ncbi:hypothetical protein [Chitinimonas lacunae]|uniref:Uncharacterized protein n=1 Tax=Chitinimonas lacunae TaxID=1963018 RepID=A0ABV8MNI8_9NEIS
MRTRQGPVPALAQFYYYEKALQAADPDGRYGPSTANVTVPYWNFSQPPSGKRYPRAFENPASPLYHVKRNHEPVDSRFPYTSPYLLAFSPGPRHPIRCRRPVRDATTGAPGAA